jgi:hypothetical protein
VGAARSGEGSWVPRAKLISSSRRTHMEADHMNTRTIAIVALVIAVIILIILLT